jgi:hypothetical protein
MFERQLACYQFLDGELWKRNNIKSSYCKDEEEKEMKGAGY